MTKLERYQKYEKCRRDPLKFLRLVRTVDPHEKDTTLLTYGKPFPVERPAIPILVQLWMTEMLLIVAKSRQELLTWLFTSLYLWDTLVHISRYTFFKSKKLEEAGDLKEPLSSLLSRAVFIFEHLPKDFIYLCWGKAYDFPKPFAKPAVWKFPNGSVIKPVSQDPKEVRGKTATGILSDETAFQPWAAQGFRAVHPTLGEDSRYTMISSANMKNFFYRKWRDIE